MSEPRYRYRRRRTRRRFRDDDHDHHQRRQESRESGMWQPPSAADLFQPERAVDLTPRWKPKRARDEFHS